MPLVEVPHQRPLWPPILVVLLDVEQIPRQHYRALLLQVQLHDEGAVRVAGAAMQGDARPRRERLLREGEPLQGVDAEIVWDVEGGLDSSRAGPEGVFEFGLVDPDFDVCVRGFIVRHICKPVGLSAPTCVLTRTKEMLQSAGMVVVQMAQHHSLDVRYVARARGFDGLGQAVDIFAPDPRQALGGLRCPVLDRVLAGADIEED